jgi:hypothetical protein
MVIDSLYKNSMYSGTTVSTKLIKVNFTPNDNNEPFQFDNLLFVLSSNGCQSLFLSFLSCNGMPKYVIEKMVKLQPTIAAKDCASLYLKLMGINSVFL